MKRNITRLSDERLETLAGNHPNAPKEKFYKILNELKANGINLYGANNQDLYNLKEVSPLAKKYFDWVKEKFFGYHRNYVLGSVPGNTENIDVAIHTILFNELEDAFIHYYPVPDSLQDELHNIIKEYTEGEKAKTYLDRIKKSCGEQYYDVWHRVQNNYHEYMKDIVNELQDMLDDILTMDKQLVLNITFNKFSKDMAWYKPNYTSRQLVKIYNSVDVEYNTFQELDEVLELSADENYSPYICDVSLAACIDSLSDLISADAITTVLASTHGYNGHTRATNYYLKDDNMYCIVMH